MVESDLCNLRRNTVPVFIKEKFGGLLNQILGVDVQVRTGFDRLISQFGGIHSLKQDS